MDKILVEIETNGKNIINITKISQIPFRLTLEPRNLLNMPQYIHTYITEEEYNKIKEN